MQLREGDTISCIICGNRVPEALAVREKRSDLANARFYLLQNMVNGAHMAGLEKYPYKFSYVVGDGSDRALRLEHVGEVKILRRKKKMNHESEEL